MRQECLRIEDRDERNAHGSNSDRINIEINKKIIQSIDSLGQSPGHIIGESHVTHVISMSFFNIASSLGMEVG
jgi:hypothetical protein